MPRLTVAHLAVATFLFLTSTFLLHHHFTAGLRFEASSLPRRFGGYRLPSPPAPLWSPDTPASLTSSSEPSTAVSLGPLWSPGTPASPTPSSEPSTHALKSSLEPSISMLRTLCLPPPIPALAAPSSLPPPSTSSPALSSLPSLRSSPAPSSLPSQSSRPATSSLPSLSTSSPGSSPAPSSLPSPSSPDSPPTASSLPLPSTHGPPTCHCPPINSPPSTTAPPTFPTPPPFHNQTRSYHQTEITGLMGKLYVTIFTVIGFYLLLASFIGVVWPFKLALWESSLEKLINWYRSSTHWFAVIVRHNIGALYAFGLGTQMVMLTIYFVWAIVAFSCKKDSGLPGLEHLDTLIKTLAKLIG